MLSIPHMLVVFVIVLVVFGPQKLPELARSLGKLMAEFRKASGDFKSAFEEEMRDLERQTMLNERRKAAEAAATSAMAATSEPTVPPTIFATQAGAETENVIAPPGTRITEGEVPVINPVAESVPRAAEQLSDNTDSASTPAPPTDHPHDQQPA